MFLNIFTGCSNNKNNGNVDTEIDSQSIEFYSKAKDWVDEGFLKKNRVRGYYRNENYIEGVNDDIPKFIKDTTSPSSRFFIITDKNEYNRIFTKTEIDVNFEKEIVILYIFSDIYLRNYELKRLELNDEILTVEVKMERRRDIVDAVMLYQRCFMLKMNKVAINEVKFELIRR